VKALGWLEGCHDAHPREFGRFDFGQGVGGHTSGIQCKPGMGCSEKDFEHAILYRGMNEGCGTCLE
jgi:hypothetical protein